MNMTTHTIKSIGVTGGAGSGKSEVLKILQNEFGAHIIMADEVSRDLCKKGAKSYKKIVEAFGEDILEADGELNRKYIADIIFADKEKREILNGITHPDVKESILDEIARVRKEGAASCVIVEAALLIEGGYKALLDELWFVYTDAETRRRRMKETRGYSDEKIDHILQSQLSDEDFKKFCDRIIDNNDTLENVRRQLTQIFAEGL